MTRKSTPQFGKVPYLVVTSGVVAKLGRSELAVYIVLMAHTGGQAWKSSPSIARIATLAGLGTRTVQRALAKLQKKGLISIRTGGGRGVPNEYTLTTNPATLSDTLCSINPATIDDTVSKENPVTPGDTVISEKGVNLDPKPCHLGDTRTEEQKKSYALARRRNKPKTKNESNHQALIAHFTNQWSEIVGGGAAYPFAGARDAKAAKTILDAVTGDLDRAKAIVDCYLIDDDPWLVENGRGRGLALLASRARLTKYLAGTATRRPQGRMDEDSAEHPLIVDAREKWPDDVAGHPEEWRALAMAVESGQIPGNAVIVSGAKTGEEFRAEHSQEPVRVAN